MRTAICHYSFHRRWQAEQWTADRLCEETRALGIEGIDFHAGMIGKSEDAPGLIESAVAKHGLTLSGLSLSNDFNKKDPDEFRAEVEKVKEWIRVSAAVKAPVSRIFGGHLTKEVRFDPAARAAGLQRILAALREVAREAETLDVVLALENHGGLPCTAEEQVEVIQAVNSPALKATIDVGNYMQGGQEAHAATRVAAPHCGYVHFKDFRKVPSDRLPWGWDIEASVLGEGDVDHRACLEALRDAGYNGFVALEYEAKDTDEKVGVPKSIEFMKQVMEGF